MKTRAYWGLSYGHHDAAVVVMQDGKIVFAERAQGKDLKDDVLKSLGFAYPPNQIYIHENKRRDVWRKVKSGDWSRMIVPRPWMPIAPTYGNHHLSHAAAGYYTSGFEDALIIVADAIGELESLAVYRAQEGKLYTNQGLDEKPITKIDDVMNRPVGMIDWVKIHTNVNKFREINQLDIQIK